MKFAFALLFLFWPFTALLAANKFVSIPPGGEIPKDKFIYAVLNLRTGQLHLGYSKTVSSVTDEGEFIGGIRNGGHVELLKEILGIPNATEKELHNALPYPGTGYAVGGGFILGSDGFTHLHPAMSNKAAGGTGSQEAGTVNPRLPGRNSKWVALIPEEFARPFYEAIAARTLAPLKIDVSITESERFIFNRYKHKDVAQYIEDIEVGTRFMKRIVGETNRDLFGIKLEKTSPQELEVFSKELRFNNLKRQEILKREDGMEVFRDVYLRNKILAPIEVKLDAIFDIFSTCAKSHPTELLQAIDNILSELPHDRLTSPEYLYFLSRLNPRYEELPQRERLVLLRRVGRQPFIPSELFSNVTTNEWGAIEEIMKTYFFEIPGARIAQLFEIKKASSTPFILTFIEQNLSSIKQAIITPIKQEWAEARDVRDHYAFIFENLTDTLRQDRRIKVFFDEMEKSFERAGDSLLRVGCEPLKRMYFQ